MTTAILTHLRNAAKACTAGYEVSLSINGVRQIVAAFDAMEAEIAALKLAAHGDACLCADCFKPDAPTQQADVDGFIAMMKDAPVPALEKLEGSE